MYGAYIGCSSAAISSLERVESIGDFEIFASLSAVINAIYKADSFPFLSIYPVFMLHKVSTAVTVSTSGCCFRMFSYSLL